MFMKTITKERFEMNAFIDLVYQTLNQVLITLYHNWPFLVISVIIASLLNLYVDSKKVSAYLLRHRRAGVIGATAAAVTTPFCSCGTTAVLLGMMASSMPWAPIVAFMVASPLTSPEELIYSAGLFGWPFALAFFTASILLGLAGGLAAGIFESRGWLKNQTRFTPEPCECACSCSALSSGPKQEVKIQVTWHMVLEEIWKNGKRLLTMFLGFAFIGYFLNGLIPSSWVTTIFGNGNVYSVPLAATLGLPFYLNTEASLPLVRSMLDSGMSQGAALSFLITGAGTSIGAIAGAVTIARWRVITLVIGILWIGAVAIGYLFNLLMSVGVLG
jgi:uncharacterized protein